MKHIVKYSLGWVAAAITMLSMASCDDDDKASNLYPAIYPESVTVNLAPAQQQLIYTDATGADVLPLIKGESVTLSYEATPEDITFNEFDWTSNNTSVATVDQNGTLNAISGDGTGYAIVQIAPRVFYSGSNIYSTLKVVVSNSMVSAASVAISLDTDNIYEGETVQLSATILPENTTYKTVGWASSAEGIASVDENGLVKGLSAGKTTITARALDNSGVSASVDIEIKRAVRVENISIHTGQVFAMYETQPLAFTIEPADATLATITWETSDASIASVTSEGNLIALKPGTVAITATTMDGVKSEVNVTVAAGFIRKDFSDGSIYPWAVQNGGSASFDGEKMTVKFGSQNDTKYRADFALANNGTVSTVALTAGEYRYFAVKMRVANDLVTNNNSKGCIVLDTNNGRYNQPAGNGNNNFATYIKGGADWVWNEPAVYYYDLQETFGNAGYLYSTTAAVDVTTFKFVMADYPKDTSTETYDVYWVRTFKTLDELKAFVDNE